jgi:hypothetical protein
MVDKRPDRGLFLAPVKGDKCDVHFAGYFAVFFLSDRYVFVQKYNFIQHKTL